MIRKDPEFLERKKKSLKSKEFLPGKCYQKNKIKHSCTFYKKRSWGDKKDIELYMNLLKKENQFSTCQILTAVKTFKNAKIRRRCNINPSPDNVIIWTPLLIGKVAFGRPKNQFIPLYKAKLMMRGVYTILEMEKMNATTLVRAIKTNEHPGWDLQSPNTITDTEKENLRFFMPQYLTANEWSPDEIERVKTSCCIAKNIICKNNGKGGTSTCM